MASIFDIRGTTFDSFFIGKGGPRLTRSAGNLSINGSLTATNLSGTNTGDQTISTITGLQSSLDSKVDLSSAQTITGAKTFSTTATNVAVFSSANAVSRIKIDGPNASNTGFDIYNKGVVTWTAASYNNAGIPPYNFTFYNASISRDGLLINGATNEVTVDKLKVLQVDPWIIPTLSTGWSNYGTPFATAAYKKLPDGTIELKGLIKKDSAANSNEVIFNLPVGFRPIEYRVICTLSNSLIGRVDILSNGDVVFQQGSNVWFSLDNIRFISEQ